VLVGVDGLRVVHRDRRRQVVVAVGERDDGGAGAQRRVDRAEERLEHVDRPQREVGAPALVGDLVVAHAREERLGLVRERRQAVEPEERRRALHRVEGAEHGVDRLVVVGRALEREQRLLRRRHALAALGEEVPQQLGVDVGRERVGGVAGVGGRRGGR
jgi:hypothetical protein